MSIEKHRESINEIDLKILELIKERTKHVTEIGHLKNCSYSPIYIPEREKQILEKLKVQNEKFEPVLPNEAIVSIFTEIISTCRNIEKPIKISYLGPEASYTHLAAIKKFGSAVSFQPESSIEEVFFKVEKNITDYGIAPIENSTEGTINYTLDRLNESSLKIVAEVELAISHTFLSIEGDIKDIKRVYSHPQSFAQCKNWVLENLKHAEIIEMASNSLAAKTASKEPNSAAIASKIAATTYGLNILHESIEDSPNNKTRFLVIGKNENKPSGHDKTSIMFSPKEEVGALYKTLEIFYRNKVNLTMIESRPNKVTPWQYLFFVDCEGHLSDEKVAKSLEELRHNVYNFKILGSYPKD